MTVGRLLQQNSTYNSVLIFQHCNRLVAYETLIISCLINSYKTRSCHKVPDGFPAAASTWKFSSLEFRNPFLRFSRSTWPFSLPSWWWSFDVEGALLMTEGLLCWRMSRMKAGCMGGGGEPSGMWETRLELLGGGNAGFKDGMPTNSLASCLTVLMILKCNKKKLKNFPKI